MKYPYYLSWAICKLKRALTFMLKRRVPCSGPENKLTTFNMYFKALDFFSESKHLNGLP